MLAITDPEDAYELHMNLIAHGRTVCRPRPRCGECELLADVPATAAGHGRAGPLSRIRGESQRVVSAPAASPVPRADRRMNKRTFLIFGLFAVLFAVVMPVWAFCKDGSPSPERSPPPTRSARALRRPTAAAATPSPAPAPTASSAPTSTTASRSAGEGDARRRTASRVENAIEKGVGTTVRGYARRDPPGPGCRGGRQLRRPGSRPVAPPGPAARGGRSDRVASIFPPTVRSLLTTPLSSEETSSSRSRHGRVVSTSRRPAARA